VQRRLGGSEARFQSLWQHDIHMWQNSPSESARQCRRR
jgi:hypothetical protein